MSVESVKNLTLDQSNEDLRQVWILFSDYILGNCLTEPMQSSRVIQGRGLPNDVNIMSVMKILGLKRLDWPGKHPRRSLF